MRDPARIDRITEALRQLWHKEPDLRLGQLVVDLAETRDPFTIEDDEMERLIATETERAPETYQHAQIAIGEPAKPLEEEGGIYSPDEFEERLRLAGYVEEAKIVERLLLEDLAAQQIKHTVMAKSHYFDYENEGDDEAVQRALRNDYAEIQGLRAINERLARELAKGCGDDSVKLTLEEVLAILRGQRKPTEWPKE